MLYKYLQVKNFKTFKFKFQLLINSQAIIQQLWQTSIRFSSEILRRNSDTLPIARCVFANENTELGARAKGVTPCFLPFPPFDPDTGNFDRDKARINTVSDLRNDWSSARGRARL